MTHPLLISSKSLAKRLDDASLFLADVSKRGIYDQLHLPEAIHVDYHWLVDAASPVSGLAPSRQQLQTLLDRIGLGPDDHVIAYDEEGGCRAARFLWLLELAGHRRYSLLDGGIHGWLADELPVGTGSVAAIPGSYPLTGWNPAATVEISELLRRFESPEVVLWDARSPAEFSGADRRAARAGHIPDAVNYEWRRALKGDKDHHLRDLAVIREELASLGVDGSREIITYCQAHHRASFTWFLGKLLGYDIRGYAGAWAEWGNRVDTPVVSARPVRKHAGLSLVSAG